MEPPQLAVYYGMYQFKIQPLDLIFFFLLTCSPVLEPYPICFELRGISMILLQCDVKHWSFVSPAAKFHLTGLVVKWEPSNINLESERKWYEGASI